MAQIFGPAANGITRVVLLGATVGLVAAIAVAYALPRSAYRTGAGHPQEQPVPFSHKHHVAGLGLDCRYCHATVETAAFAGIPPTETCMTCHSEIWTNAAMLEPVRRSLRDGEPLRWHRVHDLADFVYFDHSIHVAKGVGCVSCHGRVDQMPLVWQATPLTMEWCLDCHRAPAERLRPRSAVFDMGWTPPADRAALSRRLRKAYRIRSAKTLTDCYLCHR